MLFRSSDVCIRTMHIVVVTLVFLLFLVMWLRQCVAWMVCIGETQDQHVRRSSVDGGVLSQHVTVPNCGKRFLVAQALLCGGAAYELYPQDSLLKNWSPAVIKGHVVWGCGRFKLIAEEDHVNPHFSSTV